MQHACRTGPVRSALFQVIALAVALVAAACHAPPRVLESPAERAERLKREQQACATFFMQMGEHVGRRIDLRAGSKGTFDVLVLSGGGDIGAFGAGFLQGWGQATDPNMRRPDFDAVFGTSTGALLAPLAYIGTEASLKVGTDLYSDPPADLVEQNGLIPIVPWNESLMKPTGLRRTLEQQLDADMLAQLRKAAGQDRVLACATTNADF